MNRSRLFQSGAAALLLAAGAGIALSAPSTMSCQGNACKDIKQNTGVLWKNVGHKSIKIGWQPVVGLPNGCGNMIYMTLGPGGKGNTPSVCNSKFTATY